MLWIYGHWKYFYSLQRGDRLKSSESDVCRRQILTIKVDPRVVGVKVLFGSEAIFNMFIYPSNTKICKRNEQLIC